MAQLNVNVDNPTALPVNVNLGSSAVSTISVRNPAIKGVYVFSISNIPGVVAANNFMSLFNPVGSGRVLSFGSAFISSTASGGTSVVEPMRGFRITTATGGTLQATLATAKFITSDVDPLAEVRIGNPAVTLGPAVFNSPPVISATVGSTNVHVIPVPGGLQPFTLAPGEGIVLRTNAGDVDQSWNLSLVWAEI